MSLRTNNRCAAAVCRWSRVEDRNCWPRSPSQPAWNMRLGAAVNDAASDGTLPLSAHRTADGRRRWIGQLENPMPSIRQPSQVHTRCLRAMRPTLPSCKAVVISRSSSVPAICRACRSRSCRSLFRQRRKVRSILVRFRCCGPCRRCLVASQDSLPILNGRSRLAAGRRCLNLNRRQTSRRRSPCRSPRWKVTAADRR